MIAGIHTTKPRTQKYIDAFVRGSGKGKVYQFRDLKLLPKENLTMYGILAGSGEVYKWCEKENRHFYFMDHGYFTNAHDSPNWLRITKNKHCQNVLQEKPSDRYEKNFKQAVKPWNKGKKILVLPPTNAIANFFDATDWLDNTVQTLKKNTDREIDIREKPYNPTIDIDHVGATVKVDKPTVHKEKINWKDGDRIALFSSLAYNNWTLQEMANGTAWRMLNGG